MYKSYFLQGRQPWRRYGRAYNQTVTNCLGFGRLLVSVLHLSSRQLEYILPALANLILETPLLVDRPRHLQEKPSSPLPG